MNLVETGGCRFQVVVTSIEVCEKTEKWRHRREREVEAQEGARVEPCKAWFPSLKKSIY